jgi:voltage-gated potassium channel
MNDRIQDLENHYIVCGGGETGRHIIGELLGSRLPVVLIDQDEALAQCLIEEGLFCIAGDATDDTNLVKAGIERAVGLIVSLPSDKDNLYVTLAARMLNKNLRIVSSMTDPKLEPKLLQAGANRVVSPNFIGALRIASEMIRPTVVEFLDSMLRASQGNLRISRIVVTNQCPMIGKSIAESGLDRHYALLVLGFKEPTKDLVFNPSPATQLGAGTTLIVMGDRDDIARAKQDF